MNGPVGDEAERGLGRLRLLRQVVAVDRDPARGGLEQARDHADGGGLARAVRAQEAVDLARGDVEAHAVHGGEGSVLLDQRLDRDHGVRSGRDQQWAAPLALGEGEVQGPRSWAGRADEDRRGARLHHAARGRVIRARPMAGRMAAWRSRPPRARRMWVASAGNSLRVGIDGQPQSAPAPSSHVDLGPGVVVERAAQVDEPDGDARRDAQRARHGHVERGVLVAVADPRAQHLERGGQAHRRLLLEQRVHVAGQALRHEPRRRWRPRPPSSPRPRSRARRSPGTARGAGRRRGRARPAPALQRLRVAHLDHVARHRLARRPGRPGRTGPRPPAARTSSSTAARVVDAARAGSGTTAAASSMSVCIWPGTASAVARSGVSLTTMRPSGLSSRTTSPVSVTHEVDVIPAKRVRDLERGHGAARRAHDLARLHVDDHRRVARGWPGRTRRPRCACRARGPPRPAAARGSGRGPGARAARASPCACRSGVLTVSCEAPPVDACPSTSMAPVPGSSENWNERHLERLVHLRRGVQARGAWWRRAASSGAGRPPGARSRRRWAGSGRP